MNRPSRRTNKIRRTPGTTKTLTGLGGYNPLCRPLEPLGTNKTPITRQITETFDIRWDLHRFSSTRHLTFSKFQLSLRFSDWWNFKISNPRVPMSFGLLNLRTCLTSKLTEFLCCMKSVQSKFQWRCEFQESPDDVLSYFTTMRFLLSNSFN